MRILAQRLTIGTNTIQGPLGTKFDSVADIINVVLSYLFPIALIIFFIYLLYGGFTLASNLGNPEAFKKANARITNAVVGIILLAISYWAAKIIYGVFF
jgi:hypothetical protein